MQDRLKRTKTEKHDLFLYIQPATYKIIFGTFNFIFLNFLLIILLIVKYYMCLLLKIWKILKNYQEKLKCVSNPTTKKGLQ